MPKWWWAFSKKSTSKIDKINQPMLTLAGAEQVSEFTLWITLLLSQMWTALRALQEHCSAM